MAKVTVGEFTTRQIMYIADTPSRNVLSQEALMDLGLIPRQFPSQPVRRTFSPQNMVMTTSECDCLKQESVPTLP